MKDLPDTSTRRSHGVHKTPAKRYQNDQFSKRLQVIKKAFNSSPESRLAREAAKHSDESGLGREMDIDRLAKRKLPGLLRLPLEIKLMILNGILDDGECVNSHWFSGVVMKLDWQRGWQHRYTSWFIHPNHHNIEAESENVLGLSLARTCHSPYEQLLPTIYQRMVPLMMVASPLLDAQYTSKSVLRQLTPEHIDMHCQGLVPGLCLHLRTHLIRRISIRLPVGYADEVLAAIMTALDWGCNLRSCEIDFYGGWVDDVEKQKQSLCRCIRIWHKIKCQCRISLPDTGLTKKTHAHRYHCALKGAEEVRYHMVTEGS